MYQNTHTQKKNLIYTGNITKIYKVYKTVTKGPEFSQNVPKRDQNLYILGLAHLGFERTGGETEASWETGRGKDEAPSYWPDGREQAIAPERGRGLAAAVDYSRKRERERLRILCHVRMRSHGT